MVCSGWVSTSRAGSLYVKVVSATGFGQSVAASTRGLLLVWWPVSTVFSTAAQGVNDVISVSPYRGLPTDGIGLRHASTGLADMVAEAKCSRCRVSCRRITPWLPAIWQVDIVETTPGARSTPPAGLCLLEPEVTWTTGRYWLDGRDREVLPGGFRFDHLWLRLLSAAVSGGGLP